MQLSLAQIAIVVKDYDEALAFYCGKLGFSLIEDTVMSASKRWVVVSPNDDNGCRLLLAKAANEEQASRVGNQTGGRVFLFLHTNNFDAMYNRLLEHNISIVRPPTTELYGRVCVFADCYGNLWDLIEPAQ